MSALRGVVIVVLFALAAYVAYSFIVMGGSETLLDRLRGGFEQNVSVQQNQSVGTKVLIRVVNALDGTPMSGLQVACGGSRKHTDASGSVVFEVGAGGSCNVEITSGWSFVPIYPVSQALVASDLVRVIKVYPRGAFLPLNAVSLNDPSLSSAGGKVVVPAGLDTGEWLINVGTSTYIRRPCVRITGDIGIIDRVWLVKISGNLKDVDVGVGDVKTELTTGCYALSDSGMTIEDTSVYKLKIRFTDMSGRIALELRDEGCDTCSSASVVFVKS